MWNRHPPDDITVCYCYPSSIGVYYFYTPIITGHNNVVVVLNDRANRLDNSETFLLRCYEAMSQNDHYFGAK